MSLIPAHLSRHERRAVIKQLERDNLGYPLVMAEIPQERLPAPRPPERSVLVRMWRSRRFLAQMFIEDGHPRLSICRTTVDAQGDRWMDGITWDELMRVKAECGFGDAWAVEVYPPASSVVDVANMRHLWLLPDAPAFAWKRA